MNETSVKHRLTAILAADAAGFSRLMAVDEDATVTALDAARRVFGAHIETHQGRVIDMAGDSVLAVFETATGAVTASLAIQRALHAAAREAPDERRAMRFRIGVHLGEVIEKPDGSVYGDGVNVAARLQALAEPGGIIVSDAVRGVVRSLGGVTFVDRGERHLKNIAVPVRAFAIEQADASGNASARPGPTVSRAAAARPSGVFVGRQQELTQLLGVLDSARQGRGRVVLLSGSGGMGKTRLAQELAARAERDGVPVLWGRCLEEPGAPPYWPWRQLIRHYLRSSGDPDPARTFGTGLAEIASVVPEVGEAFAPPTLPPDSGTLDTAQSRFRLFDAIAGFWRRAAQRTLQVLIFEDLHWADPTSLRLLAFLAAELEDSAVLMVGTYREAELSRQHPLTETLAELGRSSAFSRIELAGLSERETETFIQAVGGGAASGHLVNAIHARTEGHPLFLEETLRLMMEIDPRHLPGALADVAGLLTKIPAGVREVIGRRLNRLSMATYGVLSIASCIGRTFDLELLAQLAVDRSEDELLEALEEALAVRLVEQAAQANQFRFSHTLIRECIYDEILGLRRARLHLRIGELLERRPGGDDPTALSQLAYHFSEAGSGEAAAKALAYAKESARYASRVLALEEALRLYRLALHLQRLHFARDLSERCELLIHLGEVEVLLGAGELASAAYAEAAELARQQGMHLLFARAAMGFEASTAAATRSGEPAVAMLLEAIAQHRTDDALRVELLARLCRAYVYCDRSEEAKDAHRRAVALARKTGDVRGLGMALAALASAVYWPELLGERLAAAKEAWGIAQSLANEQFVAVVLPYYLFDLIRLGDAVSLARVRGEGLALVERTGWLHYQAISHCVEGVVAINEGRFADAEASATRALQVGQRVAEERAVGVYGMQMFCLRREQGRLRETMPVLEHFVRTTPQAQTWAPGLALLYAELDMRAEAEAQYLGLPWSRAAPPRDASTMTVLMFAAEVCVYLGDTARAPLLYSLFRGHAGANLVADSGGPCLGSADRLLGSLAAVTRQWVVAQRHFEAALAMDLQTGSRVWLAHSRHEYAAMLHRRALAGDLDRARSLLAGALEEAKALGMNSLAPRIEALAEAVGAPAPSLPGGLTEREADVLRLMAIGRNNREIGQILTISPNTVANHVRSILEKTYTANRTEAAAFARREGLLKE
ncbi:helix-turn-helix transcriptional regulator [Variovorax saccharolyticus]|uniref:helix-turn-helix transcriptional regulator n=1 Tax=Variovorax saccharolyticus TaxID=3053516 RepID=UPI002578E979|nr:AAA family ATPase [Variovorax sp. J31P216]MDM0028999.1 AAA family ATPase [Variovorax sp. J31P216]